MVNPRATWRLLCTASLFASAAAVSPAEADVVSLGAARDNTLYQDADGALSNGAGEGFFAGNNGAGLTRRGLIAFDLSGIPADATINSVSLTLHLSMTGAGATDVSLHTVLANWGEGTSDAAGGEGGGIASTPGDATWIHTFYDSSFWTNPGGDFNAAASATTSVNTIGFYSWSSAQMLADVQQWLANPKSNYGWLLRGNESIANTTKRFDTRENANASFHPVLTIDYTPVPGPAGLALLMCAATLSAKSRRRT